MAVVKRFTGTKRSQTDNSEMALWINKKGELYIEIKSGEFDQWLHICLDFETANALYNELSENISVMSPVKLKI